MAARSGALLPRDLFIKALTERDKEILGPIDSGTDLEERNVPKLQTADGFHPGYGDAYDDDDSDNLIIDL
jgi:hypothetical protein